MTNQSPDHRPGNETLLTTERLQDFARSASDWFWETDKAFRFTFFSDRLESVYDDLAIHLVGKTRWELCNADVQNDPHWRAHYEDHLAERGFRDFNYHLPLPDGTRKFLIVSGLPFYNEQGEFLGYRGTARNQTDVTAARHRARKAEALLNEAIGTMNDAFAIFDAEDKLAHFNQAYADILTNLGCKLAVGQSFESLCKSAASSGFNWADERAKLDWQNQRLQSHSNCQGMEGYQIHDGRWFRADEQRLEGGETVIRIVDISTHKHAELALETANTKLEQKVSTRTLALQKKNKLLKDQITRRTEAEREYRHIFENTPVGIYRTSPKGRFIRANPALVALSGFDTEAQMVAGIRDISTDWYVQSGDRERFFNEILEHGQVTDMRAVIKNRKTGSSVAISESALAIHDGNGEIAYFEGTVQNITAQLEAQNNLEVMTQEAISANKAKSSFLAHMSHELRTPLNAILGFSETMLLGIFGQVGSGRYEGYLSNIHSSAAHLLSLINDILDLAKIEDGRTALHEEIICVETLFQATAEFLEPEIKAKSIDLQLIVPDGLPDLYCDERKIKQAMINLVANAVKFTPESGTILVRAKYGPRQVMYLSVVDTGPGIPEDELTRIVEPFERARATRNNAIPGSGLGLALVKALAEEHDATFSLTSIPGMGTTTRLTLPAYRIRLSDASQSDPHIVRL